MTLVLSVATKDCVYQVSDRRLTYYDPTSGKVTKHDDNRNKAVMLGGSIVVSFTGLAELGSEKRTDVWLAKALADFDAATALDGFDVDYVRAMARAVANAADEEFSQTVWKRLPPVYRRMSFAAAGWARSDDGLYEPYIGRLSNFENGREAFDEAQEHWTFQSGFLRDGVDGSLVSVGTHLTSKEEHELVTRLKAEDSSEASAERMVYILGETIRSIAKRNQDVGRGLLVTTIPRAVTQAQQSPRMIIAAGPMDQCPTFLYVPPDRSKGITYGPTFASGGAVVSGFTAREVAEGGSTFGSK